LISGFEPVVKGSNRSRKADVSMLVSEANEARWRSNPFISASILADMPVQIKSPRFRGIFYALTWV
jgi:hypothetical protein